MKDLVIWIRAFTLRKMQKSMKGLSREVTQSDLNSNRNLNYCIENRLGHGARIGKGGQLGSCWNTLIRGYGSWNRVI